MIMKKLLIAFLLFFAAKMADAMCIDLNKLISVNGKDCYDVGELIDGPNKGKRMAVLGGYVGFMNFATSFNQVRQGSVTPLTPEDKKFLKDYALEKTYKNYINVLPYCVETQNKIKKLEDENVCSHLRVGYLASTVTGETVSWGKEKTIILFFDVNPKDRRFIDNETIKSLTDQRKELENS